ncbi:MAG TPA: COX aromatic rich motif-containing protein [Acidiferrobacter sp.]|nr:COX aromatic rich motif-containing protein [Acidiferrobacter sp.]
MMQNFWLLNPKGIISDTQLHYMKLDVGIMLLIIVPTGLLIVWTMWRYRKAGGKGRYDPKWDHSNAIEAVVWGIPILTVAILSYYSIKAIYAVNPYNPSIISRSTSQYAKVAPLDVDVISTDWQWLFIYPKQHIATLGKLVIPAGTPIRFRLTSATVVNDFYIPQLVGMIDVMPGMRVKQSLVASHTGTYAGFSAVYSGPGFAWMTFRTQSVSPAKFHSWVQGVQKSTQHLSYADFNRVARPTINTTGKATYFSDVQAGLFDHVIMEVMNGKIFPTPMGMTESMSKYLTK